MSRRKKPSIGPDGTFLVDKPVGISSFDVIRVLRRVTGIRKLGHAGTLDPMASGLLPVLANRGTRLMPYLMGGEKSYVATVTLGVTTDSADAEGCVVATSEVPDLGLDEIAELILVIEHFASGQRHLYLPAQFGQCRIVLGS